MHASAAGSITLKLSINNLNPFSDDLDSMILDDLDVLEVEEREKVVRHMWDVYTRSHSNSIGLPQFWLEAFEAAYEHLVSDVPAVRDAAVSEIAKDVTGTALTHFTPTSSSTSITTAAGDQENLSQAKSQRELDHYEDRAFQNNPFPSL
ncbi:hypothetical protein MtrunA17_Chr3g0141491 [Medicago truncatula]|uniref:Uncharacterized protein n=1 Tax=Medicago truncatula TaxID=3880 RepID=A0A396J3I4_MEDTR|nr:hypothetical protein MtrunA17_Chr3g0141491 [Medicago truncatula]